jgi:hypothetical protein
VKFAKMATRAVKPPDSRSRRLESQRVLLARAPESVGQTIVRPRGRWPGQRHGDRRATAAKRASGHCPGPKAASCKCLLEREHALPEPSIIAEATKTSRGDEGAAGKKCDDYQKDI